MLVGPLYFLMQLNFVLFKGLYLLFAFINNFVFRSAKGS